MRFSEEGVYAYSGNPARFRLAVAGDCFPAGRLEKYFIGKNPEPALDGLIKVFLQADHALFNLEAPLCAVKSPIPKCGPNFSLHPDVANGLKEAGLDVAALANNHILDHGRKGLEETFLTLNKAGIYFHGAGLTQKEASRLLQINIKGKNVAFLSFGEGEFSRAGENKEGAAPLDPLANAIAIKEAAAANDFTVVSVHGGNEYQPFPSLWTQECYRNMIDAGADAVVGHHPHVPQGIEQYGKGVIIYSLGNFLFDEGGHGAALERYVGFTAELDFGDTELQSLRLHPFRNNSDGALSLLAAEKNALFVDYINDLSKPLYDAGQLNLLWEQEMIRRFESLYRRIFKRNILKFLSPGKNNKREAGYFFYNMLDCDAHREALRTIFKLMSEGRFKKDRSTQHELDALEARLVKLSGKDAA